MTSRYVFAAVVVTLGLGGCASVEGANWTAGLNPAVERGQSYAAAHCRGCHAIGSDLLRSSVGAPAFGTLMQQYTPESLEREFEAIGAVGHYRMPPLTIGRQERRDLVAYIDSIN